MIEDAYIEKKSYEMFKIISRNTITIGMCIIDFYSLMNSPPTFKIAIVKWILFLIHYTIAKKINAAHKKTKAITK